MGKLDVGEMNLNLVHIFSVVGEESEKNMQYLLVRQRGTQMTACTLKVWNKTSMPKTTSSQCTERGLWSRGLPRRLRGIFPGVFIFSSVVSQHHGTGPK